MKNLTLKCTFFFKTLPLLSLLVISHFTAIASIQPAFAELDTKIEKAGPDSLIMLLNAQKQLASSSSEFFRNNLNWATYYCKISQMDSAQWFVSKAESQIGSDHERGMLFQTRGYLMTAEYEWTEAIRSLKKALKFYTDEEKLTLTLIDIANCYSKTEKMDTAFIYLKKAKNRCFNQHLDQCIPYTLFEFGNYYLSGGMYDSAAVHFKACIPLFESNGDLKKQASTYGNISSLYMLDDDWKSAEAALRKATDLQKEVFNPYGKVINALRFGLIFRQIQENDSSLVYYRKALSEAKKYHFYDLESQCLNHLAILYIDFKKDHQKGLAFFKKALALAQSYNDQETEMFTLRNLGQLYLNFGEMDSSFSYLHRSLVAAKALSNPRHPIICYQKLAKYHKAIGQGDSVLYYTERHYILKDSIVKLEVEENLNKIQGEYEFEIASLRNDKLRSEVKETRHSLRLKRIETSIYIGLVIVLLLGLVAVFYFFKQRSKLRQRSLALAEAELAQKTAEEQLMLARLDQSKATIVEKNRIIEKFETFASSPEARDNLIKSLATDQDWATFMVEFNLLYPGMFTKMEALDVKLTKNDYRISALVKLKLTNKEMADILNITLSGVKAAKSRLRAKIKPLVPEEL